jgi:hypothetical protein
MMKTLRNFAVLLGALLAVAFAQVPPPAGPGGPPQTAKAAAPIDLTGYWVSIVTEDWRYRMMTPRKGDYNSVPLTMAAKKAADAWDPAKDEAAGEQCKSYGAPAIMRVPGRLHVTWQDDQTLKVEMDSGTQTRLFHFAGKPAAGPASWQGYSAAQWMIANSGLGPAGIGLFGLGGPNAGVGNDPTNSGFGEAGDFPVGPPAGGPGGRGGRGGGVRTGGLKVVTNHLRPGYLRKNGVPYSENTVVTEYYDVTPPEPNGDVWLMITTVVDDPQNLVERFITSTHFRKQADAAGWDPQPCSAR